MNQDYSGERYMKEVFPKIQKLIPSRKCEDLPPSFDGDIDLVNYRLPTEKRNKNGRNNKCNC
jgi:hypothetical protein